MSTLELFVQQFTELMQRSEGTLDSVAIAQGLLRDFQEPVIDGEFTVIVNDAEIVE